MSEFEHGEHNLQGEQKENAPKFARREFLKILGTALVSSEVAEAKHKVLKSKSKKRHEKIQHKEPSGPTPLQRQYDLVERDELSYLETQEQMERMVQNGLLVKLPKNDRVTFDPFLAKEGDYKVNGEEYHKYRRDYCRPWTKDFLDDLGKYYHKLYPDTLPLVVTSAVRPQEVQDEIRKRRLSKTAVEKSVHETGSTIDIAYGSVSKKKLDGTTETQSVQIPHGVRHVAILEFPGISNDKKHKLFEHLNKLEVEKVILVQTERSEPVFHISVAKEYEEWRKTHDPTVDF